MENFCIQSFLKLGYDYHLYVYDKVENIPKGVKICDGAEILDSRSIFRYQNGKGNGSYSGFSNYFRYFLLYQKGGVWIDTDVCCLNYLPETEYFFGWQEREGPLRLIGSAIMKSPARSSFAEKCIDICQKKDIEKLQWGETGPLLVTPMVEEENLSQWVYPQNIFFPVKSTAIHQFFDDLPIPGEACTVHFWNEAWRRFGYDKDFNTKDSLYGRIRNYVEMLQDRTVRKKVFI